jgi:hypothetical protein
VNDETPTGEIARADICFRHATSFEPVIISEPERPVSDLELVWPTDSDGPRTLSVIVPEFHFA